MKINVLSELERYGVKYEFSAEDEIRCRCPFHDDVNPSCCVNLEKQVFVCHVSGCGKTGDVITFLAGHVKKQRHEVLLELATRYDIESDATIEASVIERFHEGIWHAKPFLKELKKRAVTDDLIRQYRIGVHNGRVTIPIRNASGSFVNVRRYLPGAPGQDKMRNTRGHGRIRLFPIQQLRYEDVVLTGGELKAIVAAAHLNKRDIGCVTVTAGEGNWDPMFTRMFTDKRVYIIFDIDDAGKKAAEKLARVLYQVAETVSVIELPLDPDVYPHGDINDFVASGKKLYPLIKKAEEWRPITRAMMEDCEPEDTILAHSIKAKNTGKRIKFKALVTSMDTAPYVVPKCIKVECPQDQKFCGLCPAMTQKTFDIHPEAPVILEMVSTRKASQLQALQEGIGVPKQCKVCEFNVLSYYNAEDARLSPELNITSKNSDRVMLPAIMIGEGAELNEVYEMVGRMHPHPDTQQSTLLVSTYEHTQDALSNYTLPGNNQLEIFSPPEWTLDGVRTKLNSIYHDLESNVTRIYQRRLLHLVIDLVYHSPLFVHFDGKVIKGWVEALVVGDSAQGKSDTAEYLQEHYGLGERLECKNATVAGLLGGLQQHGGRWFVTWGVIPTHDRRLVILEEVKGASPEVISKLTDMRSRGVAEIPKIEKRRAAARTRLLWLSNSRSGRPMAAYNFGIQAIMELIGSPEDVRRFDIALIVTSQDIAPEELNKLQVSRPVVEHKYTRDLCRSLILWAWTQEDTRFEETATRKILDWSTQLSNAFSDIIPLVDRGSIRYKLARLSASVAARTYSCRESNLLVRECHVDFIGELLLKIYESSSFGYLDFTRAKKASETVDDSQQIKKRIGDTPFPRDFVESLLAAEFLDQQDLQDWTGWDRHDSQQLLSFFVRKRAIVRRKRTYVKTPAFIDLLRNLDDEDLPDRPSFAKEEF